MQKIQWMQDAFLSDKLSVTDIDKALGRLEIQRQEVSPFFD